MSALFDHVAGLHAPRSWGRILDAGTGVNSMRWLVSLPSAGVTGVTGSKRMRIAVETAVALRPGDRLIVGNWADPGLLAGEIFDTVLADYLLGAVEGFAPYTQDLLPARLARHCRGRLYVTGLEPYVSGPEPRSEAGSLVWRIGRLRDACLLLAGEASYREFPLDWMERHLVRAGFRIVSSRRFPIRYGPRFVESQIGMIRDRIGRIADPGLRPALLAHAEALRDAALAACDRLGGLRHGADYVIAAEPDPAASRRGGME
jgi:hypothetical protein